MPQASTMCALAPRLVRRPPRLLLPQVARSTAPWGPGARTGAATAALVAPRTQSVSPCVTPYAWRANGPKLRLSSLTWQKPQADRRARCCRGLDCAGENYVCISTAPSPGQTPAPAPAPSGGGCAKFSNIGEKCTKREWKGGKGKVVRVHVCAIS